MDSWKTSKQAAEELGIEDSSLRRLARLMDLGRKFGHVWMFNEADMEKLAARPKRDGRPKGSGKKKEGME